MIRWVLQDAIYFPNVSLWDADSEIRHRARTWLVLTSAQVLGMSYSPQSEWPLTTDRWRTVHTGVHADLTSGQWREHHRSWTSRWKHMSMLRCGGTSTDSSREPLQVTIVFRLRKARKDTAVGQQCACSFEIATRPSLIGQSVGLVQRPPIKKKFHTRGQHTTHGIVSGFSICWMITAGITQDP